MNVRVILICTVALLLLFGNTGARKSTGGSGSKWYNVGSRSRATPRPRTQSYGGGGSNPGKIGWNVPDNNRKQSGTHTAAKPSAPIPETVAKASATNVQSGYSPSGGYPRQPAQNPYHSSVPGINNQPGHGYNPPVGGGGYNPSVGGHAPYGQGHIPSVGSNAPYGAGGYPGGYPSPAGGHMPYGQPSYNPSFNPGYGSAMGQPPQTVILQSGQSSRPGVGQLAKEALVFAGVSAGVNAVASRLLPGGIYGTRGSGGGGGGGETHHTQITYNNYYNNGTGPVPAADQQQAAAAAPGGTATAAGGAPAAASAIGAQPQPVAPAPASDQASGQPAAEPVQTSQTNTANNNAPQSNDEKPNSQDGAQNNPNPLGYITPDGDLKKLTETLFEKDKNNAYKSITVNLQGLKEDDSKTDDAPDPLLTVKDEVYEVPTIKAILPLHDNYELDVRTKEVVTSEERREESEFLDKILETEVMKTTMNFLAEKGYIPNDEYEFKDALRRIWFSQFKRIDGDASSSGFETVFLAEQFDSDIIGLHNWIYFAKQETAKKLNYLGHIKALKLGDKAEILKVRLSLNDIVQPVTTIFVGTSPEMEVALYTMCFYTRPNNACPVSLGGTEFVIIANRVNYFGKDILVSAYPEI